MMSEMIARNKEFCVCCVAEEWPALFFCTTTSVSIGICFAFVRATQWHCVRWHFKRVLGYFADTYLHKMPLHVNRQCVAFGVEPIRRSILRCGDLRTRRNKAAFDNCDPRSPRVHIDLFKLTNKSFLIG